MKTHQCTFSRICLKSWKNWLKFLCGLKCVSQMRKLIFLWLFEFSQTQTGKVIWCIWSENGAYSKYRPQTINHATYSQGHQHNQKAVTRDLTLWISDIMQQFSFWHDNHYWDTTMSWAWRKLHRLNLPIFE